MPNQDYYSILGVSRSATQDEIRKAFKKIARESHPDVKPGDTAAAERFKQAAEAYEVLGDADNRKKYDQFGSAWKQAGQFGAGAGGGPGGAPFRRGGPVDIDLRDLFGDQGAIDLESLFGGMFGGGGGGAGRRRSGPAPKGQDLNAEIHIPFHLAAKGGEYDLTVQRGGKRERIAAKIPEGIRDGNTIRLAGKGEPGAGGDGDLLVTIRVDDHPYFRREGEDLLLDLPITMIEAALGAKVDIPTLSDGEITLTIPPGTASSSKLRLRGKGLLNPKTKQRGDQYVVIKIIPPTALDDDSKRLLEEFREKNPQNPRAGIW